MLIQPAKSLHGTIRLPGDKSVSHRTVLLSLLNHGRIKITGLSDCEDVKTSLEICSKLGIKITANKDSIVLDSLNTFSASTEIYQELYCGNSGTTARLLSGILCHRPGLFRLTGDASLSRRPMRRIIEPLSAMGAEIQSENTDKLPLVIKGKDQLISIDFDNILSSAQVKSAVLFAAAGADGTTSIIEKFPSRDHTERLLKAIGVPVKTNPITVSDQTNQATAYLHEISGYKIELKGPFNLQGDFDFKIPGDISGAAFFVTAAAMIPGSFLRIENVLLNPGRTGFIEVLKRMGAKIAVSITDETCDPSGSIEVFGQNLQGTTINSEEIPFLIDELPVLAAAMAFANGESTVKGATELRNKESDRISSLISMFKAAGINCKELADGYIIDGSSAITCRPELDPSFDHRLAMTAAIIGLKSTDGIVLKQSECVSISFPDFFQLLSQICQI